METLLKFGIPILVGGTVAYFTWKYTRGETSQISEVGALKGFTQGGSYDRPNLFKPIAAAGLQQMYFRR